MIMEQHQTIRPVELPAVYKRSVSSLGTRLNSPFPFYLNDDRKNLLMITVISAFVTVFLYAFKTQQDGLSQGLEWLHGTVTFFCLCFNIIFLPKILPVTLDPFHWTYKKYMVMNVGHLLLIGIVTTLIEKPIFCPDQTWFFVGSHVSTQVALKGIIPIILTTLFLKARLLQDNLREAIRINHELGKIQTLKKDKEQPHVPSNNHITLYSDTSESLTFNLPDLLFIEADDNYSTVIWKSGPEIQKKLLRVNLKNLESQLNNSFTLRCHRSYIVNVNAIGSISGNTNGYKLKINGSDFHIPVSRPKGKEVMDKISQLKNVMELS